MSNKHFSLLVKTLELEEQLSNSKFENYSLDNIEKDNKNKIWTFNFSGESLPSVEELTILIQKLRENFLGDYIVNYRLKVSTEVTDEQIKEFWKYIILENFSEISQVLMESILFSEVEVNNSVLTMKIMAPSIWNNFINERKQQIISSYENLGITIKDIIPNFSKTDVEAVLESQEEKISQEIVKLEEIEKKEAERKPKEPERKFVAFGGGGGTRYGQEIRDEDIVEIKDVVGYAGDVTIMAQVFGTEEIVHRNGSSQYRLKLTDYSDSIILRLFGNNPNSKFQNKRKNELIDLVKGIKKGQWLKIHGAVSNDPYLRDTIIEPKSIEVAHKEEKKDKYSGRKRIELNTHTKMSQLEGISSAKE